MHTNSDKGGYAKPSHEDIVQIHAACEQLSHYLQIRPQHASVFQDVLQPVKHTTQGPDSAGLTQSKKADECGGDRQKGMRLVVNHNQWLTIPQIIIKSRTNEEGRNKEVQQKSREGNHQEGPN